MGERVPCARAPQVKLPPKTPSKSRERHQTAPRAYFSLSLRLFFIKHVALSTNFLSFSFFLAFLYNLASYHINNSPRHTHTPTTLSRVLVNKSPHSHLSISAHPRQITKIMQHTHPARHCRCHGFRDLAARARPQSISTQPNDMVFLFFLCFPSSGLVMSYRHSLVTTIISTFF